jgi:hypothetical protein
MHFLIGFLIVVVILAIPQLRTAALLLIGVAAIGFAVMLNSERNSIPTPPSQEELARMELARKVEAAKEQLRENHLRGLIKPSQLEIRKLWLTDLGREILTVSGYFNDPGATAIVKNNSAENILTDIGLSFDLYDCPVGTSAISKGCDQLGSYSSTIAAEVPPGQVRLMDSGNSNLQRKPITNLPPLSGHFLMQYYLEFIRGRSLTQRRNNA